MSRVNNYLGIEISEDLAQKTQEAYLLIKDSSPTKNINSVICCAKLNNYKAIASSLSLVVGSLKSCLHLQATTITKIIENETIYNSLVERLLFFQRKYEERREIDGKLRVITGISSAIMIENEKDLTLDKILQLINNYELLAEIFNANGVDEEYIVKLETTRNLAMNLLIRRASQEISQINENRHNSQLKYAIARIQITNPKSYYSLIQKFTRLRKNIMHLKFKEYSETGARTTELLRFLYDCVEKEHYLINSSICNENDQIIIDITHIVVIELRAKVKARGFMLKLHEIIEIFGILTLFYKYKLSYIQNLEKTCEKIFENYARKLVSYISAMSLLNFMQVPYYLKLIIFEIHCALRLISQHTSLDKYSITITDEIIDRILGYFFDTADLRSCIASLNIFQFIDDWIGEFLKNDIKISIHQLQDKILKLEMQEISKRISLFHGENIPNIITYLVAILQSKGILSREINLIQKETAKILIKENIAREIWKFLSAQYTNLHISEHLFKSLII